MKAGFTLNGKLCQTEIRSHQRLLGMLRDDLRLTGTREGCGIDECDACIVILDGRVVTPYLVPAPSVDGRGVVIIEGVGCNRKLDPVQEAVPESHTLQRGFYTPGFIMSARALLDENPGATKEETCRATSGNLCRCTGYGQLTGAIYQAAGGLKRLRAEKL